VVSRSGYQAVLDRNIEQNAWTNQVIIGVLLVYVVIAAVNRLVTAALGRRLEHALLLSLALVVGW